MKVQPIDAVWRAHHPLPSLGEGKDKDARGTALIVGGSTFVPGAVSLVGEAALRAGAGKAKLATIERAAVGIGVAFPEAAIIALPIDDEGEIDAIAHGVLEHHVERCDALILGPGMLERSQTASLVEGLLGSAGSASYALLDAGALTAMRGKQELLRERDTPVVLTPHRVLIVAHQVVVLCLRYILEILDEKASRGGRLSYVVVRERSNTEAAARHVALPWDWLEVADGRLRLAAGSGDPSRLDEIDPGAWPASAPAT